MGFVLALQARTASPVPKPSQLPASRPTTAAARSPAAQRPTAKPAAPVLAVSQGDSTPSEDGREPGEEKDTIPPSHNSEGLGSQAEVSSAGEPLQVPNNADSVEGNIAGITNDQPRPESADIPTPASEQAAQLQPASEQLQAVSDGALTDGQVLPLAEDSEQLQAALSEGAAHMLIPAELGQRLAQGATIVDDASC